MKNWIYMLLLAATAVFFPTRGTDVGELLPVELISLTMEDGMVVASADTGDSGTGTDIASAMEDLRAGAAGEVFLETADYLLLQAEFLGVRESLQTWFRPGTLVYAVEAPVDPQPAATYLRSRTGGVALNELKETSLLETLKPSGGGVKLEE